MLKQITKETVLSKEFLNECFECDFENGLLYRNGKICGWEDHEYLRVSINNKKHYVHRIIWIMKYGYESNFIDHIDGNKKNNQINNLRDVSNIENTKNSKKNKNNKTGYTGVWFCKKSRKYHASIWDNYKKIHLGCFDNLNDAIAIRKQYDVKLNYHINHGRD